MTTNPYCDGVRCTAESGEVRRLPLADNADNAAVILCKSCYDSEVYFWNPESVPPWEELEVYDGT